MAIIIPDANIIMHQMESIFQFSNHDVIMPITVVEELDQKKGYLDEVGRNARQFFNFYKRACMLLEEDEEFIPLPNGGRFRIEFNHMTSDLFGDDIFPSSINDNRILAVSVNLYLEEIKKAKSDPSYTPQKVTLVTNDGALFAKANSLKKFLKETEKKLSSDFNGFAVELYENDRVKNIDNLHKGFSDVFVPQWFVDKLNKSIGTSDSSLCALPAYDILPFFDYQAKEEESEQPVSIPPLDVVEHAEKVRSYTKFSFNELLKEFAKEDIHILDFLVLRTETDQPDEEATIVQLIDRDGELLLSTLAIGMDDTHINIKARNIQQRMAFELLFDPKVKVVCLAGGAGSGKTVSTLAAGIIQTKETPGASKGVSYGVLQNKTFKRLMASRAVVPLGKDIGYLPGTEQEKLRPWMHPMYDNLEYLLQQNSDTVEFENEVKRLNISVEATTYMRGRSLPDQFIFIDEAQNLTPHEVKTLMTRVGENSKIVLTGDPAQIDHPYLDATNNGLTYVMERMKHVDCVGTLHLVHSERSRVASLSSALL